MQGEPIGKAFFFDKIVFILWLLKDFAGVERWLTLAGSLISKVKEDRYCTHSEIAK
jgi:hypothetical protein